MNRHLVRSAFMLRMMAMFAFSTTVRPTMKAPTEEEFKQQKRILAEKMDKVRRADGLKLFEFQDGFKVWALNQRNADRKHNNWLSYDAQ
jgi:hypothetical protein